MEMKEHKGKRYKVSGGTWYDHRTPDAVIDALETARQSGQRIRIFYGYTEDTEGKKAGQSWQEENDVSGYVGRSTGPVSVPLLVASGADGGPHMLDHCIVAIKTANGWPYKHPAFTVGTWVIRTLADTSELYLAGYRTEVINDGAVHARFKETNGWKKAQRYVAFMTGQRMAK